MESWKDACGQCLLLKHDKLSLDPQTHEKKTGMKVFISNLSMEHRDTRIPGVYGPGCLAQWEICLKKEKRTEEDTQCQLLASMCTPEHTQTHVHTNIKRASMVWWHSPGISCAWETKGREFQVQGLPGPNSVPAWQLRKTLTRNKIQKVVEI